MTEPSALMTVDQVSAHLQISPRTVYELKKRHAIPFIRIGNSLRFRRADVEAWLTERTTQAVK